MLKFTVFFLRIVTGTVYHPTFNVQIIKHLSLMKDYKNVVLN